MRLCGHGLWQTCKSSRPLAPSRPRFGPAGKGSGLTYAQFWLRYLQAHARPLTRALHYCGSLLALAAVAVAIMQADWRWLIAAPVVGYGFAWAAHLTIEHNRPETFGHPFWSFASDWRMLALFLTGRLRSHLQRAGVS
jgi:hypothetical protein